MSDERDDARRGTTRGANLVGGTRPPKAEELRRERAVEELLLLGHSAAAIASKTDLSARTVKRYLGRIKDRYAAAGAADIEERLPENIARFMRLFRLALERGNLGVAATCAWRIAELQGCSPAQRVIHSVAPHPLVAAMKAGATVEEMRALSAAGGGLRRNQAQPRRTLKACNTAKTS